MTDPRGGQVIIPAGALAAETKITIKTYRDQVEVNRRLGYTPFHGGVDFGPDGTAFALPVTVRIPTGELLPPREKRGLFIYDSATKTWDETAFEAKADVTGNYLVAQVTHFCPMGIGMFQMNFCANFQKYFDGTNPNDALYGFAIDFLALTGLQVGLTIESDGAYYVCQGLKFDVMYTVDGTPGEALLLKGDFNVDSRHIYRTESQSYDYMSTTREIIYHFLITVCREKVDNPGGGLSVTIVQPAFGGKVEGTELVIASMSRGPSC